MSCGGYSYREAFLPARKPASCTVVLDEGDDDGSGGSSSNSEVFIIDGAATGESSSAAGPGSRARKGKHSTSNVINIDDDEDEEGGAGRDKAGHSRSRASGSPAAMTPGRGSPGNRYGLGSRFHTSGSDLTKGFHSDSCDADDGGSDCEILDDTGTARKMWETAASRKNFGWHPVRKIMSRYCTNPYYYPKSSGGAKGVNGPSVPNVKKCSTVGAEKASQDIQSPRPDENSASANRGFSGMSSTHRKDGSPPISVSTPEKVDEKKPEDVHAQKDQSPPEASHSTNIYSAQDNGGLGRFVSLIGEREKLKESAEYKRLVEEEWASRQRQLQIQAEEAKKLRKRKKAEAQRLLDTEKRQKQRLQEVRESQRKEEEATQAKEQYRGAVRKELEDLERRHWDMASMLHALGISVEGGEVKAFKRALLKFHPDRVSGDDIYQQVRAEETFKFICRMKEKLSRLF